ncbi:helix-turn-helix domain-containing protein [Roseomonas arctica]|uniref:Helix-turn-helix domain-containing protein n=2 Tax=Plastoroseomonas arctica TaxID=1509237 RepID=A0AAF1JWR3_9PROT|nr:helix-turn-helix domain-containing protein [Plastoroseomonas arctica]
MQAAPQAPGHPHAFWRMKRLREANGITLEALATRSGLTKSYLSKVERGVSVPSIASALKIADAFGCGIGTLFGADDAAPDITLVRRGERTPFNRRGQSSGHRYEAIALARSHGLFEAFVDHPPFEAPPGYKPAEHRGQEMIFALKGRVVVNFPHREVRLGPGDALLFSGHMPHVVLSQPPHPAEILVIVTADAQAAETPHHRNGAEPPAPARRARPTRA